MVFSFSYKNTNYEAKFKSQGKEINQHFIKLQNNGKLINRSLGVLCRVIILWIFFLWYKYRIIFRNSIRQDEMSNTVYCVPSMGDSLTVKVRYGAW